MAFHSLAILTTTLTTPGAERGDELLAPVKLNSERRSNCTGRGGQTVQGEEVKLVVEVKLVRHVDAYAWSFICAPLASQSTSHHVPS